MLEIGAQFGFSTVAMGLVARQIVSVDHHCGDEHAGAIDSRELYFANLKRYGLEDRIVSIIGSWQRVVPLLRPEFDLVFLDADHGEEAVHAQLEAVAELAPVVAVHDYGRFGVKAAVVQFARQRGWELNVVETLATLRNVK